MKMYNFNNHKFLVFQDMGWSFLLMVLLILENLRELSSEK